MFKTQVKNFRVNVLGLALIALMLVAAGFVPMVASAGVDDIVAGDVTGPSAVGTPEGGVLDNGLGAVNPNPVDPETPTGDDVVAGEVTGPGPMGTPENGAVDTGTGAVNPNPTSNGGNDEGNDNGGDEGGEQDTTPTGNGGNNNGSNSNTGGITFGGGGGGGGGGGFFSTTGGEVLGASTVSSDASCSFVRGYINARQANNPIEVAKLQYALKSKGGFSHVNVNGTFDTQTVEAVKAFQAKHADEILKPWGYSKPTGVVYILTQKKLNELMCGKAVALTDAQDKEIKSFSAIAKSKAAASTPSNG